MGRVVVCICLAAGIAVLISGCGGSSATTAAPTQPPAAATSAPADTPTSPPATAAPTEPPTEAPPAVEPSPTTPSERVAFNWAPGSVAPSDADDVAIIADELRQNEGILGADGGESVINVFYNPTLITVEEIMDILAKMGHPVVINE